MKIAHIVSTFYPKIGGMGEVCLNEAKQLADLGHAVVVFTMDYGIKSEDNFNFEITRLRPWLRFGDGGVLPQLFQRLKDFDLTHLHYPFYGSEQWVYWRRLLSKNKLMITYHMDAQSGGWKFLAQKFNDWMWAKKVLRSADKVILPDENDDAQFYFSRFLPDYKIAKINNGVDLEIFAPRAVSARDLNLEPYANQNKLIFVGNALPVKRLDLAIRALKSIDDGGAVLLVAGGGYNLAVYQKLCRELNMQDRVIFSGECHDKEQLARYYNFCDAAVVPSDYESFSLACAEAMACGLPIIGSDIAGVRGRVKNGVNGFLFCQNSLPSFTDAINKFFALPGEERARLGEKSRQLAENELSWTRHGQKLLNVYNSL